MDPITMAIMAGSSALSLGTSFIGGQDRLLRRDKAQGDYNLSKKNFTSQDFSNVYANMENPFEDLKVNTGAADFQSKAQNSQAISADLGMQESNIATRQAEGALSIDQMKRQGELTSMGMRNEQLGTIFGIDQAELAGSESAIAQARASRTGMAGEFLGGVASNPNLFVG